MTSSMIAGTTTSFDMTDKLPEIFQSEVLHSLITLSVELRDFLYRGSIPLIRSSPKDLDLAWLDILTLETKLYDSLRLVEQFKVLLRDVILITNPPGLAIPNVTTGVDVLY